MKEIYVHKQTFRGWRGVSKEEAEELIKNNQVFGVELEMDRDEADPIKITLLKDSFGIFGATDEAMTQLMDEYFAYVEEITGMVSKEVSEKDV